jgi:transcriptional regulator with XRE-family HTH domain
MADASDILHERYIKHDPQAPALLEEERVNADIARQVYDLRTKAHLSQRALAKRVGTTASVICRLEDADYEGHSLAMLRRIADALNHRVEVRIVKKGARRPASQETQSSVTQ